MFVDHALADKKINEVNINVVDRKRVLRNVKFPVHPVVSCVMRQLFIASAIYIFHIFDFPYRTFIGQTRYLPCAIKKRYGLTEEKRVLRNAGLTLMLQTA